MGEIKDFSCYKETRSNMIIISGIYMRMSGIFLKECGFKPPEDLNMIATDVVYRTKYPNKIHYWKFCEDTVGHIKEGSDIRDITEGQIKCLIKILEELKR